MQAFIHLCLIALTWAAYFALHSALASAGFKNWLAQRFPAFMPLYRITYNLLALIFLIPPGLLTLIYPGPELWRWGERQAGLRTLLPLPRLLALSGRCATTTA